MIKEFKTFQLTFHTPLHLSRGKEGTYESSATTLHSDKLKSALYATALQLFDQPVADTILNQVRLSSAFPYAENEYWLPRPFSSTFKSLETAQNKKELKGIKYLTAKQFEAVANGQVPDDLLKEDGKARQPDIWKREVTQRVLIRPDEDSTPFYLEKLHATAGTQLYFIAQQEGELENNFWNQFKATLQLLGDNGIGLQRGLGNGQFTFKEDTLQLDLPTASSAWMALSLYRPAKHEDKDKDEQAEVRDILDKSFYQFVKRGGWVSTPQNDAHLSLRKKSAMFFTEGSVFAFDNKAGNFICKGDAAIDLQPAYEGFNHPIWRDGRAIFLPIITM